MTSSLPENFTNSEEYKELEKMTGEEPAFLGVRKLNAIDLMSALEPKNAMGRFFRNLTFLFSLKGWFTERRAKELLGTMTFGKVKTIAETNKTAIESLASRYNSSNYLLRLRLYDFQSKIGEQFKGSSEKIIEEIVRRETILYSSLDSTPIQRSDSPHEKSPEELPVTAVPADHAPQERQYSSPQNEFMDLLYNDLIPDSDAEPSRWSSLTFDAQLQRYEQAADLDMLGEFEKAIEVSGHKEFLDALAAKQSEFLDNLAKLTSEPDAPWEKLQFDQQLKLYNQANSLFLESHFKEAIENHEENCRSRCKRLHQLL